MNKKLAIALDGLCFEASKHCVQLRPMKIVNCNAADSNSSYRSFSKAYCEVEAKSSKKFLFGDVFRRGIDILIGYLENKAVPENRQERFVLDKLLSYVNSNAADDIPTTNLHEMTKGELSKLMTNHLFGKLSTSPHYTVNKECDDQRKDNCPCSYPDCQLTGALGDTSVGNSEVWHGNMDIIINDNLALHFELPEENSKTAAENSLLEKQTSNASSQNSQLIAETIVFSFLQKQKHPEYSNFLTPAVGVGISEMTIMFYDAEHDVLLESTRVPLFDSPEEDCRKFSLAAILISWLVVNYKYLSSGLVDTMQTYTADFHNHTRGKIEIYEQKLSLGNVGSSSSSRAKRKKPPTVVASSYLYKKHKLLSRIIFGEKCGDGDSDENSSEEDKRNN
ncbi:uncharacterized protein LOC133172909 [Saccostrea echinata]|uniref:uncharacterized protein LOC133172909 n=1 Tax=Saccostrea echinata TaxID=191078 RepID=UPI002A7EF930|nr:uncharacterized protein LOC133172909 [Saccostrea echinata]